VGNGPANDSGAYDSHVKAGHDPFIFSCTAGAPLKGHRAPEGDSTTAQGVENLSVLGHF
jgi:hypothetical protein